jgi:hypothetical protein
MMNDKHLQRIKDESDWFTPEECLKQARMHYDALFMITLLTQGWFSGYMVCFLEQPPHP